MIVCNHRNITVFDKKSFYELLFNYLIEFNAQTQQEKTTKTKCFSLLFILFF